ncbi:hypothetical protein K8I28_02920 [bacterium]|nr:hypothetical protein [bacterium]
MDISDPSNPTIISRYNDQTPVTDIIVHGNYLYVGSYLGYEILILDISDPENIFQHNTYDAELVPGGFLIYDNILLSTTGTLELIDITDPLNPTSISSQYTGYGGKGCYYTDDYLYLGGGSGDEFGIYNLSDLENPYNICEYNRYERIINIHYNDSYCYTWIYGHDINIVDVNNNATPILIPRELNEGTEEMDCVTNSNVLFVGCLNGDLISYDISNIEEPQLLDSYDTGGFSYWEMIYKDGFIYASDEGFGVWIIDVNNPSDIRLASNFNNPPEEGYYDIALDDEILYVIHNSVDPNLQVLDVSDPFNPVERGRWHEEVNYNAVDVHDGIAYATFDQGFSIYSVADTSNPTLLNQITGLREPEFILYEDGFIFFVLKEGGFYIYDVQDIENPVQCGYYDNPGKGQNFDLNLPYIYIADSFQFLVLDCSEALEHANVSSIHYEQNNSTLPKSI